METILQSTPHMIGQLLLFQNSAVKIDRPDLNNHECYTNRLYLLMVFFELS
jgi:hypothetical protein